MRKLLLDKVEPSAAERSALRMDLVSAWTACRRALEDLLDLPSSGGFSPNEPLERFWRDVAVGNRYAGLNPYITVEDHARVPLEACTPASLV
jgi:acyl-CoA dehydrogenase-like protein